LVMTTTLWPPFKRLSGAPSNSSPLLLLGAHFDPYDI
jgi:hypothetical protein